MLEWVKIVVISGCFTLSGVGLFLFGTSSCAGRDICGKRFCPVGIIADHMIAMIGIITFGVIGCMIGAVGQILYLLGYVGAGI